jgi:hypothetical protein
MLRAALDNDERCFADRYQAIVVIEGHNGERKRFATAPSRS